MKKWLILVVLLLVLIIIGVLFLISTGSFSPRGVEQTPALIDTYEEAKKELAEIAKPEKFTANFEIYTNGTKRIFTAAMYHNQSEDVFIQNPDPSLIYINIAGTTWKDFFGTLPFSITKECLVTGTKQTFCTGNSGKLKFILNGLESPDALEMEIKPNDFLVIKYE